MERKPVALGFVLGALALMGCSGAPSDPMSGANGPPAADASSDAGRGSASPLPCDVDEVLAANCRQCHASPPRFGAPMPLMTYADTQAPAKSDPSRHVYELMKQRIHDAKTPMPPAGALDAASLATLDAWLGAGARPGNDSTCGAAGPDAGLPVGPQALPCTPSQTFIAHAEGGQAGYAVPQYGADNLYECFTFHSPWSGGTAQGTAWAPILGDTRVLHHWILYRTSTAQADGAVGACNMPSDATFVAGWAPGGTNYVLPNDVGLELGAPGDSYILQVHYHNLAHYPDAVDGSGVAFCTTETPRAHEAGVYTLGTVNIDIPPHAQGYATSGACPSWESSLLSQPLTVISSFPHMHTLGRSIRVDVHRGSDTGPIDTLVDVAQWNFENQASYPNTPPFIFHPGDSVKTTCVYDNPSDHAVTFGARTEDEMCFAFLLLYPISTFQPGSRSCGLF